MTCNENLLETMATTATTITTRPEHVEMSHEFYRISLYYCYITIPDVKQHITFQRKICGKLQICGRIRVAGEGINGVLSGAKHALRQYEQALRNELESITHQVNGCGGFELDIKLCRLRTNLPVPSQLFHDLRIRRTDQVVTLVIDAMTTVSESASTTDSTATTVGTAADSRHGITTNESGKLYYEPRELFRLGLEEYTRGDRQAVTHLSPVEWNHRLSQCCTGLNSSQVILLDCRNLYESRIGTFMVPHATTIVTGTRQFTDLPTVLLNEVDRLAQSTHIFAFCTGGVRCERATLFLDKLLDMRLAKQTQSTTATLPLKKPKLYQLRGGIQRYLESHTSETSFFQGKNFVFDPRRTDPQHNGTVIGRCVACEKPHDDYDNGQGPSDHCESRCFQCRILILVCPDCRQQRRVVCDGDSPDSDALPLIYCGGYQQCLFSETTSATERIHPDAPPHIS